MFYLAREVGKFGHVLLAEKKVANFIMINEFKYGQTQKIWSSPLSLSLFSPCMSKINKHLLTTGSFLTDFMCAVIFLCFFFL